MGTNFYFRAIFKTFGKHIGKRSANGLYCWDCNIPIAKGSDVCPKCSKSYVEPKFEKTDFEIEESVIKTKFHDIPITIHKIKSNVKLENTPAMVELGFGTPYGKEERKGVKQCSSFTWAISKKMFNKINFKIIDEYGKKYTKKEFIEQVLDNCPIQDEKKWIGKEFS